MSSRRSRSSREYAQEPKSEVPHGNSNGNGHHMHLPRFNHNGHKVTKGIEPEGESGRKGFHPLKFLRITWKSNSVISSWVNILWPMVPVAIALVRFSQS
jgi:Ca2+:H+ antiporter